MEKNRVLTIYTGNEFEMFAKSSSQCFNYHVNLQLGDEDFRANIVPIDMTYFFNKIIGKKCRRRLLAEICNLDS